MPARTIVYHVTDGWNHSYAAGPTAEEALVVLGGEFRLADLREVEVTRDHQIAAEIWYRLTAGVGHAMGVAYIRDHAPAKGQSLDYFKDITFADIDRWASFYSPEDVFRQFGGHLYRAACMLIDAADAARPDEDPKCDRADIFDDVYIGVLIPAAAESIYRFPDFASRILAMMES